MNIHVTSLGCSKNLVDTEVMLGHLAGAGVQIVDDPAQAECLLINTCSFLTEAVEEALDRIVELARLKGHGKVNRLVVTGCLVSRYGDELLREVPEIDALVHPASLPEVVSAVTGRPAALEERSFSVRLRSSPAHRAYLKVGEGCSNHCRYCLIPKIRGEFVSRPLHSIVDEARWLLDGGTEEIVLVAQDTGRYGMDVGGPGLPDLVRGVLALPGKYWLRVLYVHPSRVTIPLLDALASDERACRYLDVPFQHVSTPVLEAMGRGKAPAPEKVLELIRSHLPDAFLRTTFMTGYPGETVDDFERLLSFVREGHFAHVGVFAFSPEEGTEAAALDGQLPPELAEERAARLMQAQEAVSAGFLKALVGRRMEVLVEGTDDKGPFGRHRGQAPEVDGVVRLDRDVEAGAFTTVKIIGSDVHDLTGKVQK